MDFISLGVGLLLGAILGILFARVRWPQAAGQAGAPGLPGLEDALERSRQETIELHRQLSAEQARLPQIEENARQALGEKEKAQRALEALQASHQETVARAHAFESEKKVLEQQLKTQREYLDEVRKQTRSEFENLAQQVLDAKAKTFSEQTKVNLENVLGPLRERISTFEKKVDENYSTEAKERFALKSEIERLIGLNERMTRETQSLTQALRGDSKTQGDWGEMVLEKILEASGLRDGQEYTTQSSFNNEEGDRLRPDVIINLPEGKHIVVDSKVSLTAYEQHRRAEDEGVRAETLDSHLKSLGKHIDELSEKHYAKLKGIHSPEFVFLFVPIEPAYLLAMQEDPELSNRAWKKGIAIVTATTLLASLKTVAHIWRLENQNKNALEIASEGAKLYDKFAGFLEDFQKIGKQFESGQQLYQTALGKLKDGPGNVFRKIERLRELGAAPNKRLPQEFIE